ncbi:MAG TPA: ClbS/DfsB family four-helix bundle protein [Candidatus Eisenbacteria bacterium]|nr:ClbS/DfsB family four-helix bundle protein [Candidatus Eisenbacteria bacterium]
MTRKQELIADLRTVYGDWERLLSAADAEQLAARRVTSKWTLKDAVAHVMAWQQISIARMQAAKAGGEPDMPAWLGGADPAYANEHVHEFNARIHAEHEAKPWLEVFREWREGFARFLELAETIPEDALIEPGRYAWLRGYSLADVLAGSCEHHREHLDAALRALAD